MKRITQISCITAAILLFASCSGEKKDAKAEKEELPLVKIEKVTEQSVPQISNYTATVEAYKKIKVFFVTQEAL